MLTLGDLRIGLPAVQAALSGYSDLAMRRVARRFGAPFCFHEVVVDRLVLQEGRLARRILDLPADDHPVGGQIMGTDPDVFGAAALVSGGIDDEDLKEFLGYDLGVAITGNEQLGLTVIVTEGFGEIAMAQRSFDLLHSHVGDVASVNGATQIRAGVMRPTSR